MEKNRFSLVNKEVSQKEINDQASDIKLKEIHKQFKNNELTIDILKEVNSTFKKEITAIVGPSGSGKSTLLSIIGTLDYPTKGTILYGNNSIEKYNANKLADFRFSTIGFIFQHYELLPTLTALENVMSPLFARKVKFDKKQRAKELLDRVGLTAKKDSLPSQLSGGEQQRVSIARALVNHPKWLLADEPTGNLDTMNSEIILDLIQSIQKENDCGVIMVTHDLEMANRANRIIEMRDGQIIKDTVGVLS